MKLYDSIPSLKTKAGVPLLPVLGSYLNGRRFCLPRLGPTEKAEMARERGLRYRTVRVLAKNLRGKLDLHGKPYQPITYVLVECDYHHPSA